MLTAARGRHAGAIVILSLVSAAKANIIFTLGASGTGDNLLFDRQVLNQTGDSVFGNTTSPQDTLVPLLGTEPLVTPSDGQVESGQLMAH